MKKKTDISQVRFESSIDWNVPITWSSINEPLFTRLDLEAILEHEQSLAHTQQEQRHDDPGHGVKGSGKKSKIKEDEIMEKAPEGTTFLDFETFMSVDLRTGTILSVENHPNADKLYVVKLDDGTENGRTLCAGLKEYYKPDDMVGKSVVFVANLAFDLSLIDLYLKTLVRRNSKNMLLLINFSITIISGLLILALTP